MGRSGSPRIWDVEKAPEKARPEGGRGLTRQLLEKALHANHVLQPPAESHRVCLNRKPPRAELAVCVSPSAPRLSTGVTCFHIPHSLFLTPSSKHLMIHLGTERGTHHGKHGAVLQRMLHTSCWDVPTRGFLASGFGELLVLFIQVQQNSQDESEMKECFIKKESIIT